MGDWQARILQPFHPGLARLTLVYDPDDLIREEHILEEIRRRGFELLFYDDPIRFRYVYESEYRRRWDGGENAELVVVFPFSVDQRDRVPHDVLSDGRTLSLHLAEFFPRLSYSVIRELEAHDYAVLFAVYPDFRGPSTDMATCDFLLRRVFKVAVELIETVPELLAYLLSRHMAGRVYPKVLDQYLIARFSEKAALRGLPLETIVPSRTAFFRFLQDAWPRFLQWKIRAQAKETPDHPYVFGEGEEGILPFDHDEIRHRVDNLFMEGFLTPVSGFERASLPAWAHVGVVPEVPADPHNRFEHLLRQVTKAAEELDHHHAWQALVPKWAELYDWVLTHEAELEKDRHQAWVKLRETIEERFERWLTERFSTLINLSYHPRPVMLHHVPHYLASRQGDRRTALVVLDGMSWVNWVQIRRHLSDIRKEWSFAEQAVFAWVPTLTNISRQALFAGESPLFFSESWQTTKGEPKLWQRFWENQGLRRGEIGYRKGLGEEPIDTWIEEVKAPSLRVLGLVVNAIDDMAHGVRQGAAGLRSQLDVWLKRGYLLTLIEQLLYNGFDVYLTSDHGQLECMGTGRIDQGILAETRGHRARIYADEAFRDQALTKHPHTLAWSPAGFPPGVFPLLARGRTAFTTSKGRIMAHGGISVEEVLVPLVKVVDKGGQDDHRF